MSGFRDALSRRAGYFSLGILVLLIVAEFRAYPGLLGVRGPGIYWALHWIRDYSNGFVRRGFLGETLHFLGVDTTDYVVLAVLAWGISLTLVLLVIESAFRLSRGLGTLDATLFLLVITTSPATVGLIAETTGDPLQLLLVAYMLVHWVVFVSRPVTAWCSAVLFGMFGLIAGLIHEASIFLVFPAVVIAAVVLVRTRAARVAAGAYLLGSVIAVGGAILASQQTAGLVAGGYVHVGAARFELPDDYFPSFFDLLAVENAHNFGRGVVGYVDLAKRVIGSFVIPFCLACLASAVSFGAEKFDLADRKRVWATFAIPILLSAPLYLIAHDWGRFAGYSFMTSLILLGLWRQQRAFRPDRQRVWILGLTLLLACVSMSMPSLDDYRISGLAADYRLTGSVMLFAVAIAVAYRRFWRTQLGV